MQETPGTPRRAGMSVLLHFFIANLRYIVTQYIITTLFLSDSQFFFYFLFRYTIVLIYYAFCLVFMMLLRPLLVKKIACGLGKTDRFKSIYAALYFFPILTVLQAVGGGLLCECVFVLFLMNI